MPVRISKANIPKIIDAIENEREFHITKTTPNTVHLRRRMVHLILRTKSSKRKRGLYDVSFRLHKDKTISTPSGYFHKAIHTDGEIIQEIDHLINILEPFWIKAEGQGLEAYRIYLKWVHSKKHNKFRNANSLRRILSEKGIRRST